MDNHETDRFSEHPRRSGIGTYIIIALLIILIIVAAIGFFVTPDTITKFRKTTSGNTVEQSADQAEKGGQASKGGDGSTIGLSDTSIEGMDDPASKTLAGDAPTTDGQLERNTQSIIDGTADTSSEACKDRADTIEAFFDKLDTRAYMQDFDLGSKSSEYFPQLIQKLINNPPIVSGETDDLFTILQNTAHFFRILGKKNILVLKGILDREQATFEQVLADFYMLTAQPQCLEERLNLTMGQEPIYAYAGFFLNTMGGRLYLFRRDSMSRMVVSYYAILIVEQANREGRNKYGIEIKGAIDNLIIEIESSRIPLQMRDIYLDTLYDLKVKYQ